MSSTLKILKVDKQTGRISLGLKQMTPDPWEEAVAKLNPGDRVTGEVTRLMDFGAFVTDNARRRRLDPRLRNVLDAAGSARQRCTEAGRARRSCRPQGGCRGHAPQPRPEAGSRKSMGHGQGPLSDRKNHRRQGHPARKIWRVRGSRRRRRWTRPHFRIHKRKANPESRRNREGRAGRSCGHRLGGSGNQAPEAEHEAA